MVESHYRRWLEGERYEHPTVNAQISEVRRVEAFHGSLDLHYERDRMGSLLDILRYPPKINAINATNLAAYPSKGTMATVLRHTAVRFGLIANAWMRIRPLRLRASELSRG